MQKIEKQNLTKGHNDPVVVSLKTRKPHVSRTVLLEFLPVIKKKDTEFHVNFLKFKSPIKVVLLTGCMLLLSSDIKNILQTLHK